MSTWAEKWQGETTGGSVYGTLDIKVSNVTLERGPDSGDGKTAWYIVTSATITVSGTSGGVHNGDTCDVVYEPATVTLTNAPAPDGLGPKLRGEVQVNLKPFALPDGSMYPARAYVDGAAADVQMTSTAKCASGNGGGTTTQEIPSLWLFDIRSIYLDDEAPIFVMSGDGSMKGSDSHDSFMMSYPGHVDTTWDFKAVP